MSILDNVKAHYRSKLSGELQKITVPEWKTDIYYKTAHPFAVETKIIELQQAGKTVEALVESVILKALDPEGKPMFNKFDKNTLMNEADPAVLMRIAAILNATTSDYEAVEKN
jgi:hypothetical protein